MSRKRRLVFALSISVNIVTAQLGAVQTNVPWMAGHASVYESPYVILYGGSQDPNGNYTNAQLPGTADLWAWDTRNGSWFHPTLQNGNNMLGQIDFKATTLPSTGQLLAVVANTTGGTSAGVLQKLDTNTWSWSFPTSNYQASARTVGHSMLTINNTVYKYGGVSVDSNGFPTSGSIQNTLALMDASSFQWTSGSNGLGLTDHSTCYLKACNCLVTFGGTSTGSATDVTDSVITYDLTSSVWNVQGLTTAQTATPGARRLHTANCLDDIMIVYGGGTSTPFDSDVWVLNATAYPTMNWQRMTVANQTNSPNLRMGHSSVLDETNKKLYIYGGWGMSSTDNNMYVLDINKWSWTRVASTGYPADAMPTLTPPTNTPDNSNNKPTSKSNTGTIAGAAVGGAIGGLIIIAVIAFFIIKKRRQARSSKETVAEDLSENMHDLQKDDNPFYYSGGGFYSTRDDNKQDYHHRRMNSSGNNNHHFMGATSTQTSLARRSEIGDSDKVVTGVLEALPSEYAGTANATLGSRSPRESFRNSKVLLSPVDYSQGQVPNEIISQKPNEFSIPASRLQHHHVPIEHLQQQQQQQPDSMEVLTSMTTNASSMLNHIGGRRKSVPITHTTVEEDENWPDSTSVNNHHQNIPIQYILPNSSHQLGSTTTSTQTWDTKHLVTHHNYPSSTLNMPIAQAVTPPSTSSSTGTNSNDLRQSSNQSLSLSNIYHSRSPLDALASLGRSEEDIHSDSSSSNHNLSPRDTMSHRFKQLAPLISMLPRRYKVDESQAPIIGPSNSILFAKNEDQKLVAIKSFGRREAWERECRTLNNLKSPCIVTILEVLTIQQEQQIDKMKYIIVMERLKETLHSYLKRNQQTERNRFIARDVLKCLEFCHSNGIAFCDLKPSNIMFDHTQWKLIDFEGSRTIDEECVGVITPRYCPPEVARATTYGLEGANGVVATASVDLWSLGCVLFELETKKALFSNNMKDETILHFISHPSPSTPILNNGLRWNDEKELEIPQLEKLIPNSSTRNLIKSLLSRDPAKRGSSTELLSHPYFASL